MPQAVACWLSVAVLSTNVGALSAQGVPFASITGHVVDKEGHPVPALVYLVLPGTGPLERANTADSTVADSLGRFTLRGPLRQGCYALFTAYIGVGRSVRTLVMAPNGSVDVGLVTVHGYPIPEMPSFFLRECERPGAGASLHGWGVDTVAVSGKVLTATPKP